MPIPTFPKRLQVLLALLLRSLAWFGYRPRVPAPLAAELLTYFSAFEQQARAMLAEVSAARAAPLPGAKAQPSGVRATGRSSASPNVSRRGQPRAAVEADEGQAPPLAPGASPARRGRTAPPIHAARAAVPLNRVRAAVTAARKPRKSAQAPTATLAHFVPL